MAPCKKKKKTHTKTYTHTDGGGERSYRKQSGHAVLGNMSASFDMGRSYMKISLCYQEAAGVRKCSVFTRLVEGAVLF